MFAQFQNPALGKWKEESMPGTPMITRRRTRTQRHCYTLRRCAPPPTWHELSKGFGAGGGDGQRELVDGDSVGDSESVDPFVRWLSRQQLPQQDTVTGGGGGGGGHTPQAMRQCTQTKIRHTAYNFTTSIIIQYFATHTALNSLEF